VGFFVYRHLGLLGCNIVLMKRSWIIFLVILFGCATTYQNLPIPDLESIKSENVRIKITRVESLQMMLTPAMGQEHMKFMMMESLLGILVLINL